LETRLHRIPRQCLSSCISLSNTNLPLQLGIRISLTKQLISRFKHSNSTRIIIIIIIPMHNIQAGQSRIHIFFQRWTWSLCYLKKSNIFLHLVLKVSYSFLCVCVWFAKLLESRGTSYQRIKILCNIYFPGAHNFTLLIFIGITVSMNSMNFSSFFQYMMLELLVMKVKN